MTHVLMHMHKWKHQQGPRSIKIHWS
ncbi:protein of unknown function [Cyanobium sp. NIES-981]|nr:protein of unknown function [Cyanobium sp. NIES-981]